jgi:hypothetical protein
VGVPGPVANVVAADAAATPSPTTNGVVNLPNARIISYLQRI